MQETDNNPQGGRSDVVDVSSDACSIRMINPERVAATSRLTDDTVVRPTQLFRLLGDPTRLRILHALSEAGELCVCDLATVVNVPETSVSHALRLLRMAGVVRSRREGRMAFYALDDPQAKRMVDLATAGTSDTTGTTGTASSVAP